MTWPVVVPLRFCPREPGDRGLDLATQCATDGTATAGPWAWAQHNRCHGEVSPDAPRRVAEVGIRIERILADNGSSYRSHAYR